MFLPRCVPVLSCLSPRPKYCVQSSGDSLSASAEDVSKSSWPKSYSVSSQGASPIHAPQKTEDDDVKPIETQLEKEAPQPAEAAVSPEPVETQEAPAPAVPEPAAAPKEQELVVEIPTGTQAQEIAEPQARAAYKQTPTKQFFANWVALADPNHDDTGSLHSVHSEATGPETVFIPKLQVEGKAALAVSLWFAFRNCLVIYVLFCGLVARCSSSSAGTSLDPILCCHTARC